jgi:hypothetical protein
VDGQFLEGIILIVAIVEKSIIAAVPVIEV